MLFNEPKLLKYNIDNPAPGDGERFSALQRAEIAEITRLLSSPTNVRRFSALQRAEIAEIQPPLPSPPVFQTPTPARRRS